MGIKKTQKRFPGKTTFDPGCHFSSYSNAAKHKEKQVPPPADRAPPRLKSHRARLSSVLRRDAPGFIPRDKVAGSPVDQHIALFLELCKRFELVSLYLQHAATEAKTSCRVSYTHGTIYGSLRFYLCLITIT